jgi:hypothetical protein
MIKGTSIWHPHSSHGRAEIPESNTALAKHEPDEPQTSKHKGISGIPPKRNKLPSTYQLERVESPTTDAAATSHGVVADCTISKLQIRPWTASPGEHRLFNP